MNAVRDQRPKDDMVDCLTEPLLSQAKPPETFVFYRGDLNAPRDPAETDELSVLRDGSSVIATSNDVSTTSQRRLQYARHLTDGQHPLVARVLVNRFWHHHFGRGLVPSMTDFGLLGEQPSHPALLDFLADEFMRQDWSLKTLHRLISVRQPIGNRQNAVNNSKRSIPTIVGWVGCQCEDSKRRLSATQYWRLQDN